MTIDVRAMLEFLRILVYCVVLSAIYTAAPTEVPSAADTDCRLAGASTPYTAGRRLRPLIPWGGFIP